MDTLFPLPEPKKKHTPQPRTKEGQAFDVRLYMWIYHAIHGRASAFPIERWVKPLKQVESGVGKMTALRGWACYLSSHEARYVSAHSFARSAGQWCRQAPDCPDDVFQSEQSVHDIFGEEEIVQPPGWVVQRGVEAVQAWLKERG